jgi:hypothetical protein
MDARQKPMDARRKPMDARQKLVFAGPQDRLGRRCAGAVERYLT